MESAAISRRGKMRSPQARNRRLLRNSMYNGAQRNTVTTYNDNNDYIETPTMSFTEYVLRHADIAIVFNPDDIIPELVQHDHNIVGNGVFDGIRCDKLCLVYSAKKKTFYYLAINDDYTCYILFKSKDTMIYLPNINNVDVDILPVNAVIVENNNRLMVSIFDQIIDLTYNPLMVFKTSEIFRR